MESELPEFLAPETDAPSRTRVQLTPLPIMLLTQKTSLSSTLLALIALGVTAAPPAGNIAHRTPQSTFVLGGIDAGPIVAFEKGACYAEVLITHAADGNPQGEKRVGRVHNEPLQLTLGLTNPAPVYEWIRQSWSGQAARRSGQLLVGDAGRVTPLSREFQEAMVAETTIPAMDKEGRDTVWLNLKVKPETIRFIKGPVEPKVAPAIKKGAIVESDFTFEIVGLDCSAVTRVDEITVTQELIEYVDGTGNHARLRPGRLSFPNLKLTVAESGAQPFIDWHQTSVVQIDNSPTQRKQGKLTLVSKTGGKRLAIALKNLGIVRVCPARQLGDATKRRLEVELFVEAMEFLVEEMPPTSAARSVAAVDL